MRRLAVTSHQWYDGNCVSMQGVDAVAGSLGLALRDATQAQQRPCCTAPGDHACSEFCAARLQPCSLTRPMHERCWAATSAEAESFDLHRLPRQGVCCFVKAQH